MFIMRKSDMSRLCLTADSTGDPINWDYESHEDDETSVYNFFTAGGAVGNPMRLHFRVHIPSYDSQSFVSLDVRLDEDDILVYSVDAALQLLESPAFAARWASIAVQTQDQSKPERNILLTTPSQPPRVGSTDVQALLATVTLVCSKPPPVMTQVLRLLDLQSLLRASAVCRLWHAAAVHDSSWHLLIEKTKCDAQRNPEGRPSHEALSLGQTGLRQTSEINQVG